MTAPGARALGLAMLAVALAALAAAAPATLVRATYGAHTTADEPHYLLTTISLAEDGDLDVADELAAERYRPFHEVDLLDQAAPGDGGRLVVPHDPLLPALLVIPWLVGGWLGAKLALAVVGALTAAATLWVAVRRFGARLVPATVTVGLLSSAGTLAVYGAQIYPEIVAALAVVVAVGAATGPPRARNDVVVAACVVALPWLAVKYTPVAAALAAVHLIGAWRAGRGCPAAWTAAGLTVAGVVYAWLHLRWYGGLTVYAAGQHFQELGGQLTVVGSDPNYPGRSRRLVGLLVDQDFGLAAWQPAWLLAAGGVAALLRRRPPGTWLLAAPAVAGWLTATFVALTMQGYWFPGRQVVVVLPLLAVAVAVWASRSRPALVATVLLGLAGLVTHVWLLTDGLAGRLTLVVDFAMTNSPVYRIWRPLLVDYLGGMGPLAWTHHAAWTAVLTATAILAWRRATPRTSRAGQTPPDSFHR